jgi:tetratricopeptide (TPR) repeat protein
MRYNCMRRGKGSREFIILLVFIIAQLSVTAQQTQKDIDPVAIYNKGKELFDSRFYASAEQTFTDYLQSKDNNEGLRADARYYIAISAMELFQDNAEALLNEFIREYPVNPKARLAYYYLGKFQWREKNYAKAIASFEKVDQSDLGDKELGEFNFMAGYANFQKKNYSQAKSYFAKVKDRPGDNQAIAAYYYGNIDYLQGNYKDALIEFEKIKNDKKFKTVIPVYITQIYLLQGKYDKVIATGEEALKDKTTEKFDDIKLSVAEAYFMQKDYAKAAEYFKSYTASGLSQHHMFQYGYALLMQEQYSDAIQAFNGLTINEDSLGQVVSYNLGNAYIKTGEKEKARAAYQFAMGLDFIPIIKEVSLLNYAKLSFELNFTKDAIDGFKEFLKKYPHAKHSEEAREILAQILINSESQKEALDIIESIPNRNNKLNGAYQRILYSYGLSIFKNHSGTDTKNYEEALGYFGKSLQYPIDKKIKALAYFWAGESRYKLGDYDKALTNYKSFLSQDEASETPYFTDAYYNAGYCYFKLENYMNAKTYFSKYLKEEEQKRTPRFVDATLRLADCNFALKDYPQALDGYQDVISSRAPETDYALYQKGLILGLQNKDEEKISTLRQIDKSSPLADDAQFAIAETYKNIQSYDKAISEYQSLNYNFPKNPYYLSALSNIAQIYINQNKDEKGIAIYEDILNKYPNTPEGRQAVKAIENSYIDRGQTTKLEQFYTEHPNQKGGLSKQDSTLYASAFSNITNGDCDQAVKALKRYLAKYPNGSFALDAHYYTADCEFKNGSNAAAIEDYNFVIAKSPNPYMEVSLKNCAGLYYKDKNYALSLQRYKQLEEIANDKQNVLLALNGELRSAFYVKEYQKSIESGNKILNLAFADENSKHEAQYYIAKSELELNQPDQALPLFEQVYKTNIKSDMGAESMYQTAYIYFTQGKNKDAENLVFELNKNAMSDYWKAKGVILLSDIYVKNGDDFGAKSSLKSIIDNYEGEDLVKIAKNKLQEINDREAKKKNESKNQDNNQKEDKKDGE